ncbi:hypothetical protein POX_b02768 [Penicillium oxalicum]|uniref:hypothetical protein n=1 Tax=Penicillium oxalicum TaxID=69781 RepID=UPI0020B8ADF2|nr:hypothetical protein POX_b02768 [Penicillium oxalicum]KAI2792726.1 hypothetical protein POX_b02768 [Penicillium oxalicum]
MSSNPSVYAAEPAYPILAHTLLQAPSTDLTDSEESNYDVTSERSWNLKDDWEKGIQNNIAGVFRCGTVIGFSRLRSRSKDTDEYVGQIPRYLLTSHLVRTPSSETCAFIIHPSNFDALSPRLLLHGLQSTTTSSHQPALSKIEALKRLDHVQLLPVQSLPNAAQAINTVSDSLQKLQEQRQTRRSADSPVELESPVIFLIAGLDTLAEAVVRASNPLRGTALLGAILRSVNLLARTYAPWLSVILVNTSGLGPAQYDISQPVDGNPSERARKEATKIPGEDSIHSVFSSPGGPLLWTLLMKTLDQGIDTHILLSDVKAAQVAEVIKDRTGVGLGKWGIWTPRR